MKKTFLLIVLLFYLVSPFNLFAGYGYFGDCPSFITINGTFYEAASCSGSSAPAINGVDFGSVMSLTLDYAEQQTWENSGDDVFSGFINYRVYTGTPGAFIPVALTEVSLLGGGNEKRSVSPGIDLAMGLAPGAYTVEFYYNSEVSYPGGGGDMIFESNGGANYSFTFTIDAPAPVELSAFKTSAQGSHILLEWQTRSAINSSHFDIQKSSDGRNWRNIGKEVSEASFSNEVTDYSFIDTNPLSGKNYYRLNIVDLDGKEELSDVLVNNWREDTMVTFFPNPVKDQVTISFSKAGTSHLILYNSVGQLVEVYQLSSDDDQSLQLVLDHLASGFYNFLLTNQAGKILNQQQFIKL